VGDADIEALVKAAWADGGTGNVVPRTMGTPQEG